MAQLGFPHEPTLAPIKDLPDHPDQWKQAADQCGLGITPFAAKVLYTFGIMRHSIEAGGRLLSHRGHRRWRGAFYVSAYLQGATVVELLGRCVRGDPRIAGTAAKNFRAGLKEVFQLANDDLQTDIQRPGATTPYTIGHCKALRDLAAHGSGATKGPVRFDPSFIAHLFRMLAEAMERYAERLQDADGAHRDCLARAAIMPLFYQSRSGIRPLFINEVHGHLGNGGTVSSDLMDSETWR